MSTRLAEPESRAHTDTNLPATAKGFQNDDGYIFPAALDGLAIELHSHTLRRVHLELVGAGASFSSR